MVQTSLRLSDKKPTCQVQETQVWSLGQKEPFEEEMATYSCILTCEIAWTEELGYRLWGWKVIEDLVTKQQQPYAEWSLTVKIVLMAKGLSQKKKRKKERKKRKERKSLPQILSPTWLFFPLPSPSIMMVTHILNLTKFYDNVICVCSYTPVLNFTSVQSLSPVRLLATPWTATCQSSLSITNSRSLLKLMPIE